MTRRVGVVAAVLVTAALLLAVVFVKAPPNEASSVSRAGRGLLLARRYLEARGTSCSLITGHIPPPGRKGVLVLAMPASGGRSRREISAVHRRLRRGGTVVLLYGTRRGGFFQEEILNLFRIRVKAVPPVRTLNPFRWWKLRGEAWRLEGAGTGLPVTISRPSASLVPGPEDRILLEDDAGRGVFGLVRKVGAGTLLVLPSEALANQRILAPGNADLLERLRLRLGGPVLFDEVIHGLGTPEAVRSEGTPMADLLLAHLLLIYLLALAALGRRMGPAWPVGRPVGGSAAGLLVRLGAVHRRRGHHVEAARAMVRRAAEYHGWGAPPDHLLEAADRARGRKLVALGRRLAELQKDPRKKV